MTDPTPNPAAHVWRQLCRAGNGPTAPIVPPELIRALELAEAALTDIGETLPGSGALRPRISRALLTWREHATPPAPTREAAPGAEISYEDLDDLCSKFSFFTDDDESRDLLFEMLRAVWARAQAARPAADQQEGRDAAGEVQP